MSDKKPGTNPLLARYKSTVDKFYKDIPDADKEIHGDGITLKRKGQNSKEDSESLEKKSRLEDVDGVNVSRENSIDGVNVSRESSVDGSRVSSTDINGSRQCHDEKEGNLENEENKLALINKRDSLGSDDKKTFFEDIDCGLRIVSRENGVDRNTIMSVNFKKTDEEPESKREKLIKTGDEAGSVDEGENGKSISKKSSFDESSCVSAEHKTASIMKISYNEKEGKLEMVLEDLTSASNKRDSVCPPDKEDGLKIVLQEGNFLNKNITTDKTEKEADKSTSVRKKDSALKQKENYGKMTTAIEKFIERDTATKKTYICEVCRVSFSSAEIKHHQKLCPSVVVKRLTVPELVSWLSFSPLKTKVVLERLKEKDIKFWSSEKVNDDGSSSHRSKKDSILRPISSSQAKLCSETQVVNSLKKTKDKEQENVCEADNKYVCGKCKMTFPDVSNLKLHLLNHCVTEPEKLKLSSETEKKDEPLAKSNLFGPKPQENSSDPKSPMIATSLLSHGSQAKLYSPGLQSKIISSDPTILMNSPNPNNYESSPETNKNLVRIKPKMKSSGFEPLIILLKNKTSVKQTSDSLTLPASVTLCMDTQKTSKLNLQTNAAIQENIVKLPAEVAKNNAWSTQETVAFPRIKQEVDDLLGTCSQSVNLKPTWMSYNLQSIDSSRSVNTSLTRGTHQVVNHDSSRSVNTSLTRGTHQVVNHDSSRSVDTGFTRGTHQVVNHDSSRSVDTGFTRGTHQVVNHDSSRSVDTSLTRGTHQLVNHDSSRSVDTSLTRGTHQVVDHDRRFTNHFTHKSDLPPSTARVTPDVSAQVGSINNSMASSDIYCLTRHYLDTSGEGSISKTTGTGSASVVGSPIPNRSALKTTGTGSASVVGLPIPNRSTLVVSTSLFSHGKPNSSTSKSSMTIQNSVTALPSPSYTAKTLQAVRGKLKTSHQETVNQLPEKKTVPGQISLSKMSQISQQESTRKSRMPSADFSCSICNTNLRTADELRKHEIVHTLSSKLKAIVSRVKKADEFVCAQCKMSFVKEEELKIHIHAHRSQNNPVIQSQVQAEEFVCGVCKQIFDTDNDLKTHITTVHKIKIEDSEENEVFYCGLCNKSFQTSSDLENHMPVHTVDKFVCGICSQPFIQSRHLIEHMGSHAGTSAL